MSFRANNGTVVENDKSTFNTLNIRGIVAPLEYSYQGSVAGYVSSGIPLSAASIDRFPFASSATNSTVVGNLTVARTYVAGQSSQSHGYSSSGATPTRSNIIDRFPFAAATTNATDVGDLTEGKNMGAGHSSQFYGYYSGGILAPGPTPASSNVIDRFPFSAITTNATDIGDLTIRSNGVGGHSSSTHGYSSGGFDSVSGYSNVIDRFPFAVETTNATDVGDLVVASGDAGMQSSSEYGYRTGGWTAPDAITNIDRFPFAVETTNATTVGNLTTKNAESTGNSSVEHGYNSGYSPSISFPNKKIIKRFPFASSGPTESNIGDLSVTRAGSAGQQY